MNDEGQSATLFCEASQARARLPALAGPRWLRALALVAGMVVLPLVNCSGRGAVAAPVRTNLETVAITEQEWQLDVPVMLTAGPTLFAMTNNGALAHSFQIRGANLERGLEQALAPGAAGSLSMDLEPGVYDLYCPLADHAGRGMRLRLRVTDGSGAFVP